ncbi:MAG: hypothetical protein K0R71_1485 [Bacillales bacterium]|nr:hypothetical protein [Bacillales bacterium]
MAEIVLNPKVDVFISRAQKWQDEYKKLREIVLDCQLTEEFKWMHPCYTFENNNVVLIHGFKEYVALTENVQAGRQIRFTNLQEIVEMEFILKDYIDEAIEVEKSGLKVELKKTSEYNIPEEFQNKLDEIPVLKTAFKTLTPGRQRAYLLYFSAPKQSKTRASRVEKYIQHILNGKGLDD